MPPQTCTMYSNCKLHLISPSSNGGERALCLLNCQLFLMSFMFCVCTASLSPVQLHRMGFECLSGEVCLYRFKRGTSGRRENHLVVVGFLGSLAMFWLFFLTFGQSLWPASSENRRQNSVLWRCQPQRLAKRQEEQPSEHGQRAWKTHNNHQIPAAKAFENTENDLLIFICLSNEAKRQKEHIIIKGRFKQVFCERKLCKGSTFAKDYSISKWLC